MAISQKLQDYLKQARASFTVAKHAVAYTAQEIAASQHVSGRQLAKSVLVNTDQGSALAVLPATQLIDLKRLKTLLGAKTIAIGKEADIKQRFPDIEVGAMSPFGNLYGVPVVVDRSLAAADQIVFNGGTHTETVTMRYQDFAALAKPKTGSFGQAIPGAAPKPRAGKSARGAKPKASARTARARRTKRPARRPAKKRRERG